MTLGSPVSSPSSLSWGQGPPLSSLSLTSPTSPQHTPHAPHHLNYSLQHQQQPLPPPQHNQHPQFQHQMSNSGFLPGFLLGDPNNSGVSGSPNLSSVSPTKLRGAPTPGTPACALPAPRGPQLLKENASRSLRGSPVAEKHSGPPTTSLLGSLTPAKASPLPASPFTPLSRGLQQAGSDSLVFPPPGSGSAVQEAEEGREGGDSWVTVWGFPPAAASFVIEQFSGCGAVLQHVMPPNSNWMHLRFQTRMQASKALSKSGTVLGGTLMVGVGPCKDSNLTLSDGDKENSVLNTSLCAAGGTNTPRTIRPLTQAYKEAHNEHKVVPSTNTPNKDSGIVGKAMGYMFGW